MSRRHSTPSLLDLFPPMAAVLAVVPSALSVVLNSPVQMRARIVDDWQSCSPSTDVCATPHFTCCVGVADVSSGKTTCRDSIVGFWGCAKKVPDWSQCTPSDVCASAGFTCCTAIADVSSGKRTCRDRALNDCARRVATLNTCLSTDVCDDPSNTCCTAVSDGIFGAKTCRNRAWNDCRETKAVNFAGVNSYFLHTLPADDQELILNAVAAAGYKAIRIFINRVYAGSKNSRAIYTKDIEPSAVGQYDDTALYRIDALMARCKDRGLKLIISLHDRWSLGTWDNDAYFRKYGSPAGFYTSLSAQQAIDARIAHVLNHKNDLLAGRPWKSLDDVVLAFEPQNEAFGWMDVVNPTWHCDRATALRAALPQTSAILVSSGGGTDIDSSVPPALLSCPAIDVVAVHSYSPNDAAARVATLAKIAADNGKRLLVEEFGTAAADPGAKAAGFAMVAAACNKAGVPWMPWEVVVPGNSSDFEFWKGDPVWKSLEALAADAAAGKGRWPWPEVPY
ncbi:glycoside hydrolase superfamily [Zopfochytrium polystomum]|nr:glycoside hydrolase superfamily [Zopfochytrium polystomum]